MNHYRGRDTLVGISGEQLSRHMAIFGGSGYGKTNLIQVAFEPLIHLGYGMAVLDFKGDLAKCFLDCVPGHRVSDLIWFDPTDREYPPALNVMKSSSDLSNEALTAELMVGLKRLYPEMGHETERTLRNTVMTLLESEGEKSLCDIPRFLQDISYRKKVLSSLSDEDLIGRDLKDLWQNYDPSKTIIYAVLNRLSSFVERPLIRNIVAQPNLIDFHQIMREGKIFIANLEKGVLQDAAFVLGSFILSRLQLAALARRPDERTLFPIIVDEFHNVAG